MFGLFMLGRTYSWTQWRAMLLVGMGAALVTQANRAHVKDSSTVAAKSDELSITFIVGVAAVLGEILLSGMVTVYFERVLKSKTENLSVWDRNVQLSFHSMIMYFFYGMVINGGSIFTNWTFAASGITFLGAIGGLLTALAVKYTDSVMKAVGQSMGVVACLIIEWLLMDGPLNLVNGIGSCVVVIAVLNYVDASNPST